MFSERFDYSEPAFNAQVDYSDPVFKFDDELMLNVLRCHLTY